MSIDDDGRFLAAINHKLASIAAASSPAPSWCEAWRRLTPQSTESERLAVYQAIHHDGSVPLEAGFYLVAWQADVVALGRVEADLHELDEQMEALRKAHGLADDDFWTPDDEPADYRELRERHQVAWNQIFVDTLEASGEREMAEMFKDDHDEFERLLEAGRQFFHGELPASTAEPGDWLDQLVDQIADLMTLDSPAGPLGYRYGEEDDFWQIAVYLTPVELVGGADDGEVVLPGFQLDLLGLRDVFDEIEDFGWDGLGLCNGDGPLIWVEGVYQGHEVYVTVLAQAPEDEEPGRKIDV
jgi:hypothetical protein